MNSINVRSDRRSIGRRGGPDALGVELHPLAADGHAEQKATAGCDDAGQFGQRVVGAERVERVAVAAQADVLGRVQVRH